MTSKPEKSKTEELAGQAIVGMISAGISLVDPHLSVALAGGSPYLAEGAAHLFKRSVQRQAQVVASAAKEGGADPADLIERLLSDPRGEQMLRHALTAARDSAVEEKLDLIARALAAGVLATDDASVDIELRFLRAMVDIEVVHVRALRKLTSRDAQRQAGHPLTPMDQTHIQLSYKQVAELLVSLGVAIDPVLATLEMHGLVARIASGGGSVGGGGASSVWHVTGFGLECLDRLSRWQTD